VAARQTPRPASIYKAWRVCGAPNDSKAGERQLGEPVRPRQLLLLLLLLLPLGRTDAGILGSLVAVSPSKRSSSAAAAHRRPASVRHSSHWKEFRRRL